LHYSTTHICICRVIEEQTLWGKTVRVWLPNIDVVVRSPRSALYLLNTARQSDVNAPNTTPPMAVSTRCHWFMPTPNNADDIGSLREKALFKELEEHKQVKKKLKVFHLDAIRAGFNNSWHKRDYATIMAVADKIPNNVLEEDPKLQVWYDQPVTRMGGK